MPISETTITGSVKTPGGENAQLTEITFKLTGSDYEGGELIAVNTVPGTVVTEEGDFTVTLWPNDKGIEGTTTYKVEAKFSDGSTAPGLKDIYVKYSATPKTIQDVAFDTKASAKVKPHDLKVMTAAAYAALSPKEPTTAYLIKA